MKKRECLAGAMACVGAVVGAGFASGREVNQFFAQYGTYGWCLIALAVAAMVGLMMLCMRRSSASACWCQLYAGLPTWQGNCAKACTLGMMGITAGAMISAAGHMVALVWPSGFAYGVGMIGTALLAYAAGYGRMRVLSWVSGLLTMLLFLAILASLGVTPVGEQVVTQVPCSFWRLVWAAVRALAYGAMNVTLAIGVVCRCGCYTRRGMSRTCALFGFLLIGLLFVSQYLYLRHPSLTDEAFPLVRLLSAFGRSGFLTGATLLYLAIFTTLAAVLYGLRSAVTDYVSSPALQTGLGLGLPLVLACIGFESLVNRWYAPAGLCCLVLVFGPLLGKNPLDNSRKIQ